MEWKKIKPKKRLAWLFLVVIGAQSCQWLDVKNDENAVKWREAMKVIDSLNQVHPQDFPKIVFQYEPLSEDEIEALFEYKFDSDNLNKEELVYGLIIPAKELAKTWAQTEAKPIEQLPWDKIMEAFERLARRDEGGSTLVYALHHLAAREMLIRAHLKNRLRRPQMIQAYNDLIQKYESLLVDVVRPQTQMVRRWSEDDPEEWSPPLKSFENVESLLKKKIVSLKREYQKIK